MKRSPESSHGFQHLLRLAQRLREPDGCEWDREQTVRTLARHLVEESFEVLDAAERGDDQAAQRELGDLAFVLALALCASADSGGPSPANVFEAAERKIRRRHPHVFEGQPADTSAARWRIWEDAKKSESDQTNSAPRGENEVLPALLAARKLQERAAGFGFDWRTIGPVLEKVREELREVEDAIPRSRNETRAELGDLLFSVVNLSRFLEIEAEGALRAANDKFRVRFDAVLARVAALGRRPEDLTLEELDQVWNEVKRAEPDRAGNESEVVEPRRKSEPDEAS